MRPNAGLYIAACCVLAPLLWVVFSVDVMAKKNGFILLGGALLTVAGLLAGLVRSHRRGGFAPNRCKTCDHPMRRVREGELRPPAGHVGQKLPTWRCVRCGRLV